MRENERMPERESIVLSWSGGKDSAMALYELRRSDCYDIACLLTTVSQEFDRISHHGVRLDLLERQAEALGLPLETVMLPGPACSNEEYEAIMTQAMQTYSERGLETIAFGDIFLADIRAYRERHLAEAGMRGLFPLWHRDTAELAQRFLDLGFAARICCIDGRKLTEGFAGRSYDAAFLAALPDGVDPCGEYGEFHSFVHDGPDFAQAVALEGGEVVKRDDRWFADLLPAEPDKLEASAGRGKALQ